MDSKELKRRSLLKGSLLGGLAAASGAPALAASKVPSDEHWDDEYDVIVIGSGTGLLAALMAAKVGKRVLIVEKNSAPGGNSIVSGGVLWIPNNRVMQREGLRDSRDAARRYIEKLSQGQSSDELIDAFIDNGPDMLDYLEANTAMTFRVSKLMGDVADYHPEWPGALRKGRSVEPVQPQVALAGGILVGDMLQAALAAGATLLTDCPAEALHSVQQEEGQRRVTGVSIRRDGRPQNVRAREAVLMASGGFERNWEMKKHFLRGPSPYTLGTETNTGDGIRMGMALGAALSNMNEAWGLSVYKGDAEANGQSRGGISLSAQIERRNAGCIVVNRHGQRFCNEAADYDVTWRSYHDWENWGDLGYRNLPAFQLFDQGYREHYPLAGRTADEALPDWVQQADTLEALADKLGIDAGGLTATVERFNRFAAEGKDPDFHRGESAYDTYGSGDPRSTLGPLSKGPFYGAEVSPADIGTCGGLKVNGKAEVLDVFDQPIAGLYASGNTTGVGSPGALYGGGGGTLGPALTFAYIAGRQLSG